MPSCLDRRRVMCVFNTRKANEHRAPHGGKRRSEPGINVRMYENILAREELCVPTGMFTPHAVVQPAGTLELSNSQKKSGAEHRWYEGNTAGNVWNRSAQYGCILVHMGQPVY